MLNSASSDLIYQQGAQFTIFKPPKDCASLIKQKQVSLLSELSLADFGGHRIMKAERVI
jgi:hypothetical protein